MIATAGFKAQPSTKFAQGALSQKQVTQLAPSAPPQKRVTQLAPGTLLLLALTTLTLTACGVLPKREPATIYEPTRAAPVAHAEWPQANWSLLVAKPMANQLLDSDRITVRPSPGTVQVYKGASWSDATPELLQTALVRSFEDSQKILSVGRPGAGVRGEYQLVTELRAFESVYAQPGSPQAVIEVYAKLIHTADGEVVAARSFRETEAANGEQVGTVVDAFSRALDRVSSQIVGWTLDNGGRHEREPKRASTAN